MVDAAVTVALALLALSAIGFGVGLVDLVLHWRTIKGRVAHSVSWVFWWFVLPLRYLAGKQSASQLQTLDALKAEMLTDPEFLAALRQALRNEDEGRDETYRLSQADPIDQRLPGSWRAPGRER